MSKARDLANAGTALGAVTATELGYVDGVTSAIQTQLNAKQAVVSGVDDTEIGYLNGVTSAIQTQIDSKIGSASAINPTIVDAKGDIIAATAADTVARLAVGANDTVLTADSTAATGLKWATPSSGGMTLISTTSLTGASVTISSIPQTYNSLQLIIRNYKPSVDNMDFYARANGITSNSYISHRTDSDNGGQQANGFNDNAWNLLRNDNVDAVGMIVFNFYDYTNTTTNKFGTMFGFGNNTTTPANMSPTNKLLIVNTQSALTSLTFFPQTGNFTSGSILLYGVK